MKKSIVLMAALMSTSFAAPYVWSANVTTSKPSEVKTGGTLRMVQLKDFDTYNPFTSQGRPSLPELHDGEGGLIKIDPVSGDYEPYMADKMTISKDGRTFTFTLRPELKWSDGQAITADDFISTLNIIADEKVGDSLYSYLYEGDKKVTWKKLGNLSLSITFPAKTIQNLETISYLNPRPDHVFGATYRSKGAEGVKALWDLKTDPKDLVVAGPWKVERYVLGERVVLTKNKYFGDWNKDSAGRALPYINSLQYNIVPDQNAALAQFLAGNTDIYAPSNRDQLSQIAEAKKGGKLDVEIAANVGPQTSVDMMYFNMNKSSDPVKQGWFRDKRFRQAMSMLVNKEAMIDQVLGGFGFAAWTSVYPLYKDWVAPNVDKYKYNPAGAAKLLAQMGFKKGKDGMLQDSKGRKLSFILITNSENNRRQQLARLFADEAKKVGVDVKTNFIPFNQLLDTVGPEGDAAKLDRKFDVAISGLSGGGFINPVGVAAVLQCGGDLNNYNASKKCIAPWETQMYNLYLQSRKEFDINKRKAIANKIQALQAENLGNIYLVSQSAHYAWDSRLQGELPKKLATPLWASSYFGLRYGVLSWINEK
ncbi:ABC transporter substrate-binding protein [Deinococcus misasensis]|uniref:ABC transporter substrate-binding protein n=1 Tax=Deinococcus misasensis TaxID=392413 RepID=UPI00054CEBF8|nr:ABC transporter substrate-binding protein [Deinococcus misasensis]